MFFLYNHLSMLKNNRKFIRTFFLVSKLKIVYYVMRSKNEVLCAAAGKVHSF
jgi:hypothetical protein